MATTTQTTVAQLKLKSTMLLDAVEWDFVLDVHGNIAVATAPYSLAQDAASAIRLFEGELWYNTVPGVPYWDSILGRSPPLALLKAALVAAAMTVPGVVTATCVIASIIGRKVSGQVQVTDSSGRTSTAAF